MSRASHVERVNPHVCKAQCGYTSFHLYVITIPLPVHFVGNLPFQPWRILLWKSNYLLIQTKGGPIFRKED